MSGSSSSVVQSAVASTPGQPASSASTSGGQGVTTRKEIYEYTAPWLVYGMAWSSRPDFPFRLAIGSFLEEYSNRVDIISLNDRTSEFERRFSFEHPYPATRILWMPQKEPSGIDLLGSTGDYMRLWEVTPEGVQMKCCLNNNKNSEFCAPLTSFDWNETDNRILGTSSIDTTCTIWDIQTGTPRTQLIAHDKEVYDIAFAKGTDVFASVGGDGSVRTFDLRSLDHSTVIYETPNLKPLLRLCWNKQDSNYLATVPMDSSRVIILDTRVPSIPVAELDGHTACVNAISWAPHSSCHICTAGDDAQALIWDLSHMPKPIEDPILAYNAECEVNSLSWSSLQPDWVSIAVGKKIQILRV
eukprot:ANDGO_07029.mRNA.1 DDB1- and CUL4-associated factor 7 homolog